MKNKKVLLKLMITLLVLVPVFSFAEDSGYIVNEKIDERDKEYKNSEGGKNAILFLNGDSKLTNVKVQKTGDSIDNVSNSAIVCLNNASLDISSSSISTNGSNSSGIVASSGGIVSASDLTITTNKDNSYCLASFDSESDISVDKGTYETFGAYSPVVYASSFVTIKNATLKSDKSEAIVAKESAHIKLENVNITSNNENKNEKTSSFMNILLSSEFSKDDETKFDLYNSTVTTNKGDTFLVSTNATINMENNKIINNDNGAFIKIVNDLNSDKDVDVNLSLANQKVTGDIIVDSSSLHLNLNKKSVITGSVNKSKTAKYVYLTISSDSVLNLTGDCYIDELSNGVTDNSNIYLNGYKLYVKNELVKANTGVYEEEKEEKDENEEDVLENSEKTKDYTIYIVLGIILVVVCLALCFLKIKNKKKI